MLDIAASQVDTNVRRQVWEESIYIVIFMVRSIYHGSLKEPATLQLCRTVIFCPIDVKIHLLYNLVSYLPRKKKILEK